MYHRFCLGANESILCLGMNEQRAAFRIVSAQILVVSHVPRAKFKWSFVVFGDDGDRLSDTVFAVPVAHTMSFGFPTLCLCSTKSFELDFQFFLQYLQTIVL